MPAGWAADLWPGPRSMRRFERSNHLFIELHVEHGDCVSPGGKLGCADDRDGHGIIDGPPDTHSGTILRSSSRSTRLWWLCIVANRAKPPRSDTDSAFMSSRWRVRPLQSRGVS